MPITKAQAKKELKKNNTEYNQVLLRIIEKYDEIERLSDQIGWRQERTTEWYTPPKYLELAREVLGGITLDPASNATAQARVKAQSYYTQEQDGLKHSWFGTIWCNPPYGTLQREFLRKGLDAYRHGEIESAIFLVNRTGAAWYLTLRDEFDGRCEVRKRIAFINPEGEQEKSPRYYNDFLYLGGDIEAFSRVFSSVGRCTHS